MKRLGDNESDHRDSQILELSRMGKSIREIASLVGCGKSTVSRIIHRSKESANAVVPSVPPSQPLGERDMGQDGTPDISERKEAKP